MFLSVLACSACTTKKAPISEQSLSSMAFSSEEIQETRNVSYRGTLEPLGPSIYQQGTHMLALGDGRMILLESSMVDFDPFIGTSVEVFGALRPTVEAGGIIMRVEQIIGLSAGSGVSISSHSSSSSSSSRSSEGKSSLKVVQSSAVSFVASSLPAPSSAPAVSRSSTPVSLPASSLSVSSAAPVSDAGRDVRVRLMAKEDISAARWTQLYCSSHIGFCIPIHKNWWYISFGNTSDTLWHVEINSESFETLGSGIISIDLIGGDIGSSGHSDSEVRVSGDTVTGYRSWTQGRHFAISADARLEAAVRYMTAALRAE